MPLAIKGVGKICFRAGDGGLKMERKAGGKISLRLATVGEKKKGEEKAYGFGDRLATT